MPCALAAYSWSAALKGLERAQSEFDEMNKLLVPLYIVGGGFGLLMTACAAAWVYEKTRRRLEHPVLGCLTHRGDSWTGLRHYRKNEAAIRFELPGDKNGPDQKAVERFELLWASLEESLSTVRPHAIAEYEQIKECYEESEHRALVDEISAALQSSGPAFDKYWSLAEVGLREEPKGKLYWQLDFEVAWDIEHSRAAYLDLDGQVLTYNLSCAVVDPWSPS